MDVINQKFIGTILIVFCLSLPIVLPYKMETPINATVHQHITNESKLIWKDVPFEIKNHARNSITNELDGDYDTGNDIISGSGEEDKGISLPFLRHFWQPDDTRYTSKWNWRLQ